MGKNINEYYIGLDIGGTKCAVVVGDKDFNVYRKVQFETRIERGYIEILNEFHQHIEEQLNEFSKEILKRIGIS